MPHADDFQGEFDFDDDDKREERSEQAEHLERVSSRIARAIIRFCAEHKRFYAEELRRFVIRETGIAAPASADRVLRDLRQKGVIRYQVLNRRLSLYQMIDEDGFFEDGKDDD